ncbi:MAG TPA: purine-nucleoside phosphorylase [Phototrophicaceae bacterium]|nr:purine-nucleoside phosphorylase [Phototrophicaceae bacterium]
MVYQLADYEQAAALVQSKITIQPAVGLVLGSGLGALAEAVTERVVIPYETIPGWPSSTVPGHSGQLVVGRLEGVPVIVQQGRAHFYEGYDLRQVTFPIRVMHLLGVKTLILTNAAGGLNPAYRVGDLMLFNDHINLPGMVGNNPLMGPNDERLGPRFVGMVQTYDRELRQLAHQTAAHQRIKLHEGVYVCLSGPNFETPAEVRMLRGWGADAVGMSTVHEVLVARHVGMRVLAFSGITNEAINTVDTPAETNHEEVLDAGKILVPRLTLVLKGVLQTLT